MTPALIKARELRIEMDRKAAEAADLKNRNLNAREARQKLVVDALNAAFAGAMTTHGQVLAEPCATPETVCVRAGRGAFLHVTVEPFQGYDKFHYRIRGDDSWRTNELASLVDEIGKLLAPLLDLSAETAQPVYLTAAERAAAVAILTSFHPVPVRPPGVDVPALIQKLRG